MLVHEVRVYNKAPNNRVESLVSTENVNHFLILQALNTPGAFVKGYVWILQPDGRRVLITSGRIPTLSAYFQFTEVNRESRKSILQRWNICWIKSKDWFNDRKKNRYKVYDFRLPPRSNR